MHSYDLASLLALVLLVVAIAALWDILRRPSDDFGRPGRSYYIWIILATAGVGGFAWFLLSRNRLRRPRRTGQPSGRRPTAAREVQTAPAKAIAVAARRYELAAAGDPSCLVSGHAVRSPQTTERPSGLEIPLWVEVKET